jgi:hypothetical protein
MQELNPLITLKQYRDATKENLAMAKSVLSRAQGTIEEANLRIPKIEEELMRVERAIFILEEKPLDENN